MPATPYDRSRDKYKHRLPAAPLARIVERMLDRAMPIDLAAGADVQVRETVYENLGIDPRNFYRWRQPRATIQVDTADNVLTRSPYLWFDVWPQCDGKHVKNPRLDCEQCVNYYRARRLFTGRKPPKGFR